MKCRLMCSRERTAHAATAVVVTDVGYMTERQEFAAEESRRGRQERNLPSQGNEKEERKVKRGKARSVESSRRGAPSAAGAERNIFYQ